MLLLGGLGGVGCLAGRGGALLWGWVGRWLWNLGGSRRKVRRAGVLGGGWRWGLCYGWCGG